MLVNILRTVVMHQHLLKVFLLHRLLHFTDLQPTHYQLHASQVVIQGHPEIRAILTSAQPVHLVIEILLGTFAIQYQLEYQTSMVSVLISSQVSLHLVTKEVIILKI